MAGDGEGRPGGRPITLAAIAGAHGITGEVRLKLFAESVASLAAHRSFAAGGRALTLTSIRPGPHGAVARFAEVTDRNAAEALRGIVLTVPRAALPPLGEGEYYHADLIGLPCVAPDGAALGRVAAIENFGAGDVLEIEQSDGKRVMIAFREPGARLDGEQIVIDPEFLA